MSRGFAYFIFACLLMGSVALYAVYAPIRHAPAPSVIDTSVRDTSADDTSAVDSSAELALIQEMYTRLHDLDVEDIYLVIADLEQQSQSQSGEEKYKTLLMVLDYYFWLDDVEKITETVAQLRFVEFSDGEEGSRKLTLDLYDAYVEALKVDYNSGVASLESGLNRAYENNDIYSQALALGMMGAADTTYDNYHTSIEKLQTALNLLDGRNDEKADRVRVGLYMAYAFVYTSLDYVDKTIEYYTKVVDTSLKYDLSIDIASIMHNVGFLLIDKRNYDQAQQFFEELLGYYSQVGDPKNLTYPYYALAFINYFQGDYQTSQNLALKAYEHVEGLVDFEATLLQLLAENEAWLGDVVKAKEYLTLVDAFFEQYPDFKDTTWEARSIRVRAVIAYAEGRHHDAIKEYENFHQTYSKAQSDAYSADAVTLTNILSDKLSSERAEGQLLRKNIALEKLNVKNQQYLNGFIIFLLLLMAGLVLFQLRWSKVLKLSKLEAEKASRSKSDFLAQMSHELRTPLNAIIGFSEMMSKSIFGDIKNKKYKDYTIIINQSGLHLLRIINDILDISKVESGKIELLESKFDLCEIIDEIVLTMSDRAAKAEVTIINNTPDICSYLYADSRIVKQILFNIMSNSIKFTPEGGKVWISYELAENGDVILEIKDNGQGMNEDELEQAMEPFGQVKSVLVQSHEGTGLGLPLVKAFMELHQGTMNITSASGEGTSVELCFPSGRVL